MPAHHILVASYTNEIVTLTFEPDANRLGVSSTLNVGHHPSWVERHPVKKEIAFTALEQPDGELVTLQYVLDSGKGKVLARSSTGGKDPCTIAVSKDQVLVGNYSSGSLATYPTQSSAYLAASSPKIVAFTGSGPNAERQTASHAHHVVLHGAEVLVADLGSDKTWRLRKDKAGEWKVTGYIQFEAGSGPRHIAIHDEIMYTVLELSSQLASHRLLAKEAEFIKTLATKFEPPSLPTNMLASEICIPKPSKTYPMAYIYVSNRNDVHPEGDSIAIFSATPFELVAEVRTGLKHVRGAVFGGTDDRWLIVGGVLGGGVKIFERVDGGKGLKELVSDPSVQAPTSFVWL